MDISHLSNVFDQYLYLFFSIAFAFGPLIMQQEQWSMVGYMILVTCAVSNAFTEVCFDND